MVGLNRYSAITRHGVRRRGVGRRGVGPATLNIQIQANAGSIMLDKLKGTSKTRRGLLTLPLSFGAGLSMNSLFSSKPAHASQSQAGLRNYGTVPELLNSSDSALGPGTRWSAGIHSYTETDATGHLQTAGGVNLLVEPSLMGYDVRAFGAAGASQPTDDSTAFLAAISAAVADGGGDIFIPRSEGRYMIRRELASPEIVNWIFQGGVVDCTDTRASLLINGGVRPSVFHTQCFAVNAAYANASALKIRSAIPQGSHAANTAVAMKVTRMSPEWFDGSMSEKIQKVFQVGGSRTVCTVPSGQFPVNSTISMSEENYGSHLVLEGSSFVATALEMPAGSSLTGVDASVSDECEIKNIRIIEASGKRTGICFALGGTSLKVNNCWAGNAKYGYFQNKGSGTRCTNNFVEACNYGYLVSGNLDMSRRISGAPAPTRGVRDLVIDGGMTHRCDFGICLTADGKNHIRGVTVNNVSCKRHRRFALGVVNDGKGGRIVGVSVNTSQFLMTESRKKKSQSRQGVYVKDSNVTFTNSVFADNNDTGILVDGNGRVVLATCQFGNYYDDKNQRTSVRTATAQNARSANNTAQIEQVGVIEF